MPSVISARQEAECEELIEGERPDDYLDAAEVLPFPSMAFARNPWEQKKYYPFMGVIVWPRNFR